MLGRPAAAQHRATATNPPNPHRMLSAHPHPAAARNQHFAHRSHDEHTTKHEPTQLRGNLTTCKIPKSSMHRAATTSTRRHTPGRCQSQWRQHQSLGAQPAPNGIVHDSTSNTVLGFLNPSYPLSLVPFALPGLLLIVVIHLGQSPLPMPLVSFPKPSKLSTILPGENPISLLLVRDVLPHVASPIVGPLLPTLSLHSPTDELTSVHQTAAVTHQCPAAMRYPINNLALVDSTSMVSLENPVCATGATSTTGAAGAACGAGPKRAGVATATGFSWLCSASNDGAVAADGVAATGATGAAGATGVGAGGAAAGWLGAAVWRGAAGSGAGGSGLDGALP
eukprot:CAMPEP_0204328762 /NCGR_PEP_ID=MMETSP0469-20131031/13639_1 /ASSEMBLY_ACC=CAM_ASM_000384 /TAXON_ID=2969 /ORGANISM="Oxyrrhis marina" /LENGTH=336 /DNA_ID=CAMNT_0051311235 /DNA_START=59 /DNA_END=1067 /DNA_ORIENTATION=+